MDASETKLDSEEVSESEVVIKKVRVRKQSFELYVCVQKPKEKKFTWYTIDTRTNEIWEYSAMNRGGDPSDTSATTLINSGCAIIHSKIYIIGGQKWSMEQDCPEEELSKAVSIFDTQTDTWTSIHSNPMSAGRAKPLLVPYVSKDGTTTKLLVFGGCKGKNDVWCESMNVSTHKWTSLAPPPDVVRQHETLFGYACMGDTIVLWNQSLFCIYYVDKDMWLDIVCHVDFNFEGLPGRIFKGISTVVAYKNLIIWFIGTHLDAYDLSLCKSVKSSLCNLFGTYFTPPFDSSQASYFRSFLVRSDGGRLCALWADALEGSDICSWMTFKTLWDPKGCGLSTEPGPVFSSCIGSELCHVLTGYQSPFNECWFGNENKDDRKFVKNLASTMYMKSYLHFTVCRDYLMRSHFHGLFRETGKCRQKFSLSVDDLLEWLHVEEKTKEILRQRIKLDALNSIKGKHLRDQARDQFPLSVDDILKWFNLEEKTEKVLRKIINLDALNSIERKDLLEQIRYQFPLSVDELLEWFHLEEKTKEAVKKIIDSDALTSNQRKDPP